MAASTTIVDFTGPGSFALTTPAVGDVHSLLMLGVTNLGGIVFQVEDSDGTQLTGPIILGDLQQFVTNIGTTSAPLAATAAGKGLKLKILSGGRLTGLAVVDA